MFLRLDNFILCHCRSIAAVLTTMVIETRKGESRKSKEGGKEESAEGSGSERTGELNTTKDLVVKLKKRAPALKIKIRRSKEGEASGNTLKREKLVVKIPIDSQRNEQDSQLTRELLSILGLQGAHKTIDTVPNYLQDGFLILWDFLIQFGVIIAPLAISPVFFLFLNDQF